jgi:hypothetical protein
MKSISSFTAEGAETAETLILKSICLGALCVLSDEKLLSVGTINDSAAVK